MTKVTSLYSSTKIMIIAESEYFLGQNCYGYISRMNIQGKGE